MEIYWSSTSVFKDIEKVYDSVSREVLYNVVIEFCIPRKLVRLIKMCLNETCSKVDIGEVYRMHFLFRMV
jgi:hypothetical protein